MNSHLTPAAEQKIRAEHQSRLAVVYVRQSTVHQVQHHKESTQLQYGLVEQARRLGWPQEQVLVIDEDLGLSGASAERRLGFQRLLSEVAFNHVGLILGVEMSRLARSCKDWYQLLELCAMFRTLIGDLDGLYDPTSYNDRLLLGLKGTMSEAELHILKQRMLQGALQKARRGELVSKVPIGYVRNGAGEVQVEPDEQARSVVQMVFEQFQRLGSGSGLLRWLV
jgi:DNA invertase Pin-like site-specific DNA recombinase